MEIRYYPMPGEKNKWMFRILNIQLGDMSGWERWMSPEIISEYGGVIEITYPNNEYQLPFIFGTGFGSYDTARRAALAIASEFVVEGS